MKSRVVLLFIVLSFVALALFVVDLATGAVPIPLGDVWAALAGGDAAPATAKIVRDIRLVKAVVAVAAGMALSVSGLQMQTLFRNPLAGPYVLGISSGASLGVALFILGAPLFGAAAGGGGPMASLGMAGAAWVGSASILLVIAAVSRRIRDIMVILILGMMFSSGVGAVVQILQYLSREEALKSFVIWTMGSLGDVTAGQLALLLPAVALGLGLSVAAVKPLNLLLLGEQYARTMGLDVRRARLLLFLSTILLAGTVTAFCGPIGFVGLAVPHVARMLFRDADHRVLMPASALAGAVVLLACDIVSKQLTLPVNTITALLGIPVVVWVVVRNKSIA
ncbi:iron ABC transporter permease [uncultured Alistipes sp.]|uniref:FecCD family ABC transporter permease n=1 Tax=uncultured Alistipes sp. TaxID=538949 RepID=UPI002608F4A9|nr:iron ABC transporter permease [uncultured Alistipes sp.]